MIVQSVREDLVIEDIRFRVPRGVPVTIPGNLACDSRDLGKLMSQNRIIELGTNPRLDNALSGQPRSEPVELTPVVAHSELLELRYNHQQVQSELRVANLEIQRLKGELESANTECGQLLAECSQLRIELGKFKGEDSKLNTILEKLDSMPAQVVVQASGKEFKSAGISVEDDVPNFVPTFDTPKKLTVKEDRVEGNSAAVASKALRELRKGKSR